MPMAGVLVAEGAESKLYMADFLGISAIVKDRIQKDYRVKKLDDEIRKTRTKKEARILAMASENGLNVPRVLLVEDHRLVMTRISGSTLLELVAANEDVSKPVFLAGELLARLHRLDIAHGDYTPVNIIVDGQNGVWAIDFGLADMTTSVEDKAIDLILMKRSLPPKLFSEFIKGYAKGGKPSAAMMKKADAIERRGRYQARTLA
jgi:TP53 regulating kinase-like protein